MGVFNAAENQVLISPVTNYYKGEAIRAGLKQTDADLEYTNLRSEALRQEIDYAPAKRRKAAKWDDFQLEKLELLIQDARGKYGDAEMQRRADSYWPILNAATKISEAGDPEGGIAFVNEELPKAAKNLGPEVWREFVETRGSDDQLSEDEIFGIGLGIETFRRIVEDPSYTLAEGAQRRGANNELLAENPKAEKPADFEAPNNQELEAATKLVSNDEELSDLGGTEERIAAQIIATEIRQLLAAGYSYDDAAAIALISVKRKISTESGFFFGKQSKLNLGGHGSAYKEYRGIDGNTYIEGQDGSFSRKN